MSGSMDQWNKQMAKIDQAIERTPAAPASPAAAEAGGKQLTPQRSPAVGRRALIGVWVRLVLVTLLAVGLTVWPYARACGFGLFAYLGAVVVTIGTGVMTAVSTWRLRAGLPHVLSLLIALAGLVLLAHELAVRIGYAAVSHTWLCP